MERISVVIPAYNEEALIRDTLDAVRSMPCDEIIVVDDGSTDQTSYLAQGPDVKLIRLIKNCGKGAALTVGWEAASGDILVMLDADLGNSAREAHRLITPVIEKRCDMSIALLPQPMVKCGMGLVKATAKHGIRFLTGSVMHAPLSGQRAFRRELLCSVGRLDHGFGIEVALTVGALWAGKHVLEVPVSFTHRETRNDWSGYTHRGKELFAVGRALGIKWRERRELRG